MPKCITEMSTSDGSQSVHFVWRPGVGMVSAHILKDVFEHLDLFFGISIRICGGPHSF